MNHKEKLLWLMLFLFVVCVQLRAVHAESVFAVASHSNSKIKAYLINGDEIDYQTTIKDTESFGIGATGFCVWPEKQRMFVTYEGKSIISWASTKTLSRDQDSDEFNTGVSSLAGMAVDEGNSFLYVLTRSGGHLYTYTYDENENTLSLIHPNDPCYPEREYRQLEGINGYAYDLALDEQNGLCYVSNGTETVRYYNTTDWAYEGSISMGEKVAGMGIDSNNYLYAGYFNGTTGYHNYLLRYYLNGDPDDPKTAFKKDMDAIIMDIAVDSDNGLIYTTTGRSIEGSSGTVEVYDVSDCTPSDANYIILTDTEYDDDFTGNKPAGIAIGPQYKPGPPGLHLVKTGEIENDYACVLPEDVDENKDEITYEIFYWNEQQDENDPNYLGDLPDVVIVDRLSNDVNFVSAEPDNGFYDPNKHAYILDIGTLEAGEKGTLTLTVRVKLCADPCGVIFNFVEIESEKYYKKVRVATDVCCFGGDIIYVDRKVGDPNNGTSWELAYNDLQDALARAAKGCGSEIWVAQGVYKPTEDYGYKNVSFSMIDGVEIYGGFAGDETIRDDRDYASNKTYLTGDLDSDGEADSRKVVTAGAGVSSTAVLDGFLITKSTQAGIRCNGADPAIIHCAIVDNDNDGVYCADADPSINNCVIMDNGGDGIDLVGSSSPSSIKNCWICRNGTSGNGNGISFENPDSATVVRNNTIADNANAGVYQHAETYADISNCIIWGNEGEQLDLDGKYMPTYSCIQDSNDVTPQPPYYNINTNPYFAYTDPNLADYHLDPCSPCVDAGDPCDTYDGEKDIDGDDRVLNGEDYSPDNGRVDMGADEVACDEIYNSLDWNVDAIVDIEDLIILANAWLSDPNATNWDDRCDLNSDDIVNWVDFAAFGIEWLWQPCWRASGTGVWMMMGMGGGMGRMMGMESVLISETATVEAATQRTYSEPTIEEQIIAQVKETLKRFETKEVKEQTDEDTWLWFVTSLEEMLKEFENSR